VADRLDEAIFRPLTLDEIAGLTEAFSNSDLPYKVDLVDLAQYRRSLATGLSLPSAWP
jgi:hypothetical protein